MKKNINFIYLDSSWSDFIFSFKNKSLETNQKTCENNTIIVQTYYNKSQLNLVIWYGNTGYETLVFDSTKSDTFKSWNWDENKNYRFEVSVKDLKKVPTVEIKRLLTEKEGKDILKNTPHKLGKWDSMIDNYDIQCACGEWMSNPTFGRVIDCTEDFINDTLNPKKVQESFFTYNNRTYMKLDFHSWHVKTWFNRSEFEAEEIRVHGKVKNDFDKEWNKYFNSNDNKEYVEKPNMPGAAWRSTDGTISCFSDTPMIGSYEKVISLGYMSTPAPGTICCPCCDLLHRVYSETSAYCPGYKKVVRSIRWRATFSYYKLKQTWYEIKERIKNR